LLDLRLPLENGLEVLRKLRDSGCQAPIIVISAHGDASTVVQAFKDGAMDYFEKPFEAERLMERIRELLKTRSGQGTLTRLAKRLAPHEAGSLFREIAPALVLAVFSHLQRAADVRVVAQAAEHLCRDDVQARLRKMEHVREGIVDELAAFLRDEALLTNRETLMSALESSGTAYRLLALEACLVHTGAA
jgi:DNA-binding response OmpR family regulator